jgi:hypothetical protein
MANAETVRRIALTLPEVEDNSRPGSLAFEVGKKGFAWTWQEQIAPKTPRRARIDVLAVRCDPELKEAILASDPRKFFTEPHYNGFPAVLVRLTEVDAKELRALLTAAWRCQAPKRLVKERDGASFAPRARKGR